MPILNSELEIVPYDPQWPFAFEAEAVRLRNALGRWPASFSSERKSRASIGKDRRDRRLRH